MTCPKCGKEIPDGSRFCLECGSNISESSRQSGVEGEMSLGNVRTMGQAPERPTALSLGDRATMRTQNAEAAEESALAGIPLSDRYEVIEEIGRGGFAVVYKARDKRLDRTVAVKRLLPEHLSGQQAEQTIERFIREARSIASLNHRNIVQVYDYDRDAEGHYIVMEHVDGGTLRDYLKEKGKLAVPEAIEIIQGIGQGLSVAHRRNLVHRDIKPGNILLTYDGDELIPKLVDFGLARAGCDSTTSMMGYGMGTPYYMPPEQRRDAKSVNQTADIYALGKTLYEMVTGEIPDNVDPENIQESVLSRIIMRCVKSKPEDRYFSVDDLLRDLGKVLKERPAVGRCYSKESARFTGEEPAEGQASSGLQEQPASTTATNETREGQPEAAVENRPVRSLVLCVITLGGYCVYWFASLVKKSRRLLPGDRDKPLVRGMMCAWLLAPVLYTYVVSFLAFWLALGSYSLKGWLVLGVLLLPMVPLQYCAGSLLDKFLRRLHDSYSPSAPERPIKGALRALTTLPVVGIPIQIVVAESAMRSIDKAAGCSERVIGQRPVLDLASGNKVTKWFALVTSVLVLTWGAFTYREVVNFRAACLCLGNVSRIDETLEADGIRGADTKGHVMREAGPLIDRELGYHPVCPRGGVYVYDGNRASVNCTFHGYADAETTSSMPFSFFEWVSE